MNALFARLHSPRVSSNVPLLLLVLLAHLGAAPAAAQRRTPIAKERWLGTWAPSLPAAAAPPAASAADPSAAGYAAMARAVDLALFRSPARKR